MDALFAKSLQRTDCSRDALALYCLFRAKMATSEDVVSKGFRKNGKLVVSIDIDKLAVARNWTKFSMRQALDEIIYYGWVRPLECSTSEGTVYLMGEITGFSVAYLIDTAVKKERYASKNEEKSGEAGSGISVQSKTQENIQESIEKAIDGPSLRRTQNDRILSSMPVSTIAARLIRKFNTLLQERYRQPLRGINGEKIDFKLIELGKRLFIYNDKSVEKSEAYIIYAFENWPKLVNHFKLQDGPPGIGLIAEPSFCTRLQFAMQNGLGSAGGKNGSIAKRGEDTDWGAKESGKW